METIITFILISLVVFILYLWQDYRVSIDFINNEKHFSILVWYSKVEGERDYKTLLTINK